MKSIMWLIFGLFFTSIFGSVAADETYVCTFGQQERVINVVYKDQKTKLPCEVRYQKDGATEILWKSTNKAGFCEAKAEEFLKKQLEWGWRCNDAMAQSGTAVTQPMVDQMAKKYKIAAAFAQALATMSSLKILVAEYYMMEGEYPNSLKKIGIKTSDMKTSAHISNLTLKGKGEIYAKGNESIGETTVIRLAPKQALGGLSMEWECTTNIKVHGYDQCAYEKGLGFPR